MYGAYKEHLKKQLVEIKSSGLYKNERIIVTPQGGDIKVSDGSEVINFCANNYLGLSSHPRVIQAAKDSLDTHGFGLSSVRFICGTQDIHKTLEHKLAEFLGTEDTILYAAAFDANGGVFEPLLTKEDAIISFLPEVKPPIAPPKAFPKVPVIMSTLPITLWYSWVPLPVLPTKPVEWHSSTITKASYLSAKSQILSS